ncbi:AraC family transcriptional regulator [Streptomyces sp. CRN 30]|uniref:helix-turn-helix transcriptional regulator n=1 Tax=Streptomyces sp. CRN 30 TaxID=3075613 RepID=UPI002A8263E6|nr:AraC family transcriptional regulator [Streptomyces sp. CRN 30]
MDTIEFGSDDLKMTEEFLSSTYARMRLGSNRTSDTSPARIRRDALTEMTVDQFDIGFEMSYAVAPLGRISVCMIHTGAFRDHTFPGVEETFGPGDTWTLAPPDEPYAGRVCDSSYTITMLDPALFDQVATTAGRHSSEPVRLTGHRPHSPAAARHLRHSVNHVRDHILSDPVIADQPLVAATAAQHLAASVLTAFPSTALTEPTGPDRADAHPATLRRAIAYIDDHADRPVSVADIAGAAHVTIRALQYAFRRHLDTTPLAHLRRVRLSHAHRDLVAATPYSGATVTEIAARWGFFHPGRFAALYRGAYGRTPLRTLVEA